MTQTLRVRGPADFLALIPALMGGTPQESVVLLLTRRDGHNGVLRADIPATTSTAILKRCATQLMGMLCRVPDVDAVTIVVFTNDPIESVLPHVGWAEILAKRTEQMGFRIHEVLCRARDGWGSYRDANLPVGGQPLSDIEDAIGRMPAGLSARTDYSQIPLASDSQIERTQRELAYYRALVTMLGDADSNSGVGVGSHADADAEVEAQTERVPAELEPLCDLALFVEDALSWEGDEIDARGSLLIFALQGPPARDTTMLQWAYGLALGDQLYDELESLPPGLPFKDSGYTFGADLILGIGPRPERKRILRGIELLLILVGRAGPTERRPLLCMLGWLNWALGSGTHAAQFVALAREIDSEYGMAELLEMVITVRQLPDWIFIPPTERGHTL